jgi:hypothetical protein
MTPRTDKSVKKIEPLSFARLHLALDKSYMEAVDLRLYADIAVISVTNVMLGAVTSPLAGPRNFARQENSAWSAQLATPTLAALLADCSVQLREAGTTR